MKTEIIIDCGDWQIIRNKENGKYLRKKRR